ncbi:UPF0158 family protein [uncultured Selenomonas sp.]|uniref:UPF0158 family protein n=1 Tax=uncultured Selenomonas sp. TaxID=159275 RepID=UPI0028DBD708|nr:UPF0158 family protein [uncultured Selenomonas sp.]
MEISLQELSAALEKTDILQGYVDTREGRILMIEEDVAASLDKAAQREEAHMESVLAIEEDWQRYVPLPNLYDMEIRSIMQGFAEKAPAETRLALEGALCASAARRRFFHTVRSLSLEKVWREYLSMRLLVLAREWCEENDVAYCE